jgi:electron transfer flavoprotein beta subunit
MSGLRILVGCKRVVDYAIRVRPTSDKKRVDTAHLKHSLNPFDEIAIEEAVRMKEKNMTNEIIAVSIGSQKVQEILRTALAMGVDRAIHVDMTDLEENFQLQPLAVAKIFKALALKEKIDMVIMGKQAIDDDHNQTGQILAGLLNWSQGTFASKILPNLEKKTLEVTREVDGGLDLLLLRLPAVITTDLRLNEPRYATLPNIMKSRKMPIHVETRQSLNLNEDDLTPRIEMVEFNEPPKRKSGVRVHSVEELVEKLRNETGLNV